MRKQKEIWEEEHSKKDTLPTMDAETPASGVVQFVEYLKENNIAVDGKAVDIGCGKGRNAIFLAREGLDVVGIDYIDDAIKTARGRALAQNVTNVEFQLGEVDDPWPFDNESFDFAVDSFASIDIETSEGRKKCRDEMLRTLKPGAYALVTVVSSEDEWEKELIAQSPGSEKNSTVWPQNGKFQKDYDEEELREFYKEFDILELRKIVKPAFKLGKNYTATNFWIVLKKNRFVCNRN